MLYSLSHLDPAKLDALHALEARLGKPILAFEGHPAEPSHLTEVELAALKAAEQELGLVLIAAE